MGAYKNRGNQGFNRVGQVMNWTLVYDFFVNQLIACRIDGLDKKSIAIPGEIFDPHGKTLWIEISAFIGNSINKTESKKIIPASMNIITCVPRDSTMKKASTIAAKIERHFSLHNNHANAYRNTNFTLRLDKVTTLSGVTDSSGYRINTRLSITIEMEN